MALVHKGRRATELATVIDIRRRPTDLASGRGAVRPFWEPHGTQERVQTVDFDVLQQVICSEKLRTLTFSRQFSTTKVVVRILVLSGFVDGAGEPTADL